MAASGPELTTHLPQEISGTPQAHIQPFDPPERVRISDGLSWTPNVDGNCMMYRFGTDCTA